MQRSPAVLKAEVNLAGKRLHLRWDNSKSKLSDLIRLLAKDRPTVAGLIPRTAWGYYFFPDMDMEIAATGSYPPPEGWGANAQAEPLLDETGTLVAKGMGTLKPVKIDMNFGSMKVMKKMMITTPTLATTHG